MQIGAGRVFGWVISVMAVCSTPVLAVDYTIFSSNFDNGIPIEFSGAGNKLHSVDGFAGLGPVGRQFSGNILQNDSGNIYGQFQPYHTVLTLNNLPQHSGVSIKFLLGIMNTWDGLEDYLNVKIDGVTWFHHTFAFDNPTRQTWNGGVLTTRDSNGFWTDYGFDNSWGDSAYNLSNTPFINVPHTAFSLTVDFFTQDGFNGADNESFGIDNMDVILHNVVPEPAFGGGMVLIGSLFVRRCRRF